MERLRIGQTRGDLFVQRISGDCVVVREPDGSFSVMAYSDVQALPVTQRALTE